LKYSFQILEKPKVGEPDLANREDKLLGVRNCDPDPE
jgi:hypothetical protein